MEITSTNSLFRRFGNKNPVEMTVSTLGSVKAVNLPSITLQLSDRH